MHQRQTTHDRGGQKHAAIGASLDDLRRWIGIRITDAGEPWNHEATRDSIRHYAHGIGDDNPLWTDPAYAERTCFGTLIALPSFLFSTSRIVSGYCGGLPGMHSTWAGADWTWHKPVLRGDAISTQSFLKELVECQKRLPERNFQQTHHTDSFNQDGDTVAQCDSWAIHTERDQAREHDAKHAGGRRRVERFTDAQLARFYELYDAEQIRGATPRYWEDVNESDVLPRMVKGPMTVAGFICYAQGWGGPYIRANKLAYLQHAKHSSPCSKNRFNVPDSPERVHWDEGFARGLGMPGAYDYGPERCSWLIHQLTNWMGDDGFLYKSRCQIRGHNVDGDVLFIDGVVMGKFVMSKRHFVEISQIGLTHRGELSMVGSAIVELPCRRQRARRGRSVDSA